MSNLNVEVKSDELLAETDHFALWVGKSDHTDTEQLVYKISNKETGVVEAESSVLANGYNYIDQLEEGLVETISKRERAIKNKVILDS